MEFSFFTKISTVMRKKTFGRSVVLNSNFIFIYWLFENRNLYISNSITIFPIIFYLY